MFLEAEAFVEFDLQFRGIGHAPFGDGFRGVQQLEITPASGQGKACWTSSSNQASCSRARCFQNSSRRWVACASLARLMAGERRWSQTLG